MLRVLAKAIGKRSLASIGLTDLLRWYDEAKRPKAEGKPERIRKAHGIIKMLRRLFAFGKSAEIAGSARLVSILEETRFKQPPRRRAKLERHHVEAFIPVALTAGRLSLAIGTAAQFETMMRQRDVIGEWQPIGRSEDGGGIVVRGRRWANGLTWQDLQDDFVLRKHTTKTGALVAHDLKLCPLTFGLLSRIPGEKRVGPVIVDETAGRPYAEHAYSREWRRIARRAGIPDEIWNMDARAGAITEAEDAGADLDSIRSAAGHTQASTTSRYSRGPIGKSRGVATLRQAHLTSKNSE